LGSAVATIQPTAAAKIATGATSAADEPTRSEANMPPFYRTPFVDAVRRIYVANKGY
jgi:hypothetical protein